MWLLNLILIVLLWVIFFQDARDRMVYWFLYPLVGIMALAAQITHVGLQVAVANVLVNLSFILILVAVCYAYARLRLDKPFREVIGLGDVLFFAFICFSFSTISFLVLFVFSMIFALALHLRLYKTQSQTTVPLAGYMALFFSAVYLAGCFNPMNSILYSY